MRVFRTDAHSAGQIYIRAVNWTLFFGCVFVTIAADQSIMDVG
ncbi:MAG: KUP/HAK/KT family potassium transporter [Pirellula sp.]